MDDNAEFGIALRAMARGAARDQGDMWTLLPGDGPASVWLIDAVGEATGAPVVSATGAPVNMARVRMHLREWGQRNR